MGDDFKVHTKVYKLYIFSSSKFFQFNFSIKIYFCYFLVPDLREEREREVVIFLRLREKNGVGINFDHQNSRSWCQSFSFGERSFT